MNLKPVEAQYVLPLAIAGVAFLLYSFFPWATNREQTVRFNSPDETANYVFSDRLAVGAALAVPEPLALQSNGVLHPRSTVVAGETVVPASFIGLPVLYGIIGLVLGDGVLPYLTPLVAALSLLALWGLWRRLMGDGMALVTMMLTALHPAFWYYASRGFYHNMLFVALLVFTVWAYVRSRETKTVEWFVVAVCFLLAALFVRTVEALWVVPFIFLVLWYERRHLTMAHVIIGTAIIGTVVAFSLLLFAVVYGSPFPTGYHQAVLAVSASAAGSFLTALRSILLPLGFDAGRVVMNVIRNAGLLFLPFWIVAVLGWRQSVERLPRMYLYAVGIIAAWLFVYYGSWNIRDSVGFTTLTIGTSFARYWLPIYVLTMPLVAIGLSALAKRLHRQQFVIFIGLIALFAFSFSVVYFDKVEGLVVVADRLVGYRAVSREVNQYTPAQAVIVSDRSDKVFYPDRKVITPGGLPFSMYPEVVRGIAAIADVVPVYVYVPDLVDQETLHRLREQQLILLSPRLLSDGGFLYPLVRL